jgi:hypothetical protein
MNDLEQAAADLDAAADVIDLRGWCQNRLVTRDGRVCAEGGVIVAITQCEDSIFEGSGTAGGWLDDAATSAPEYNRRYAGRIRGALRVLEDFLASEVHYWNDRDYATRDEVTDTIRRAAKDVREQAGGDTLRGVERCGCLSNDAGAHRGNCPQFETVRLVPGTNRLSEMEWRRRDG